MHRYISTDNGLQCFACGMVLDYMSPDDPAGPYETAPESARDALEDIARSLAFGLCRPGNDSRAHHYVLEGIPPHADGPYHVCMHPAEHDGGYALRCAYDGQYVGPDTDPSDPLSVDPACTGA